MKNKRSLCVFVVLIIALSLVHVNASIIDDVGIDVHLISIGPTSIVMELRIASTFGHGLSDYGVYWYPANLSILGKGQSTRIGEVSGLIYEMTLGELQANTSYTIKAFVLKDGEYTLSEGFTATTLAEGSTQIPISTSTPVPSKELSLSLSRPPETYVGKQAKMTFTPSGGTPPYTVTYSTITSYDDESTNFGEDVTFVTDVAKEVSFGLEKAGEIVVFAKVTDTNGAKESAIPSSVRVRAKELPDSVLPLELSISLSNKVIEVGDTIQITFTPKGGTPPYLVTYSSITTFVHGAVDFSDDNVIESKGPTTISFTPQDTCEIVLFANVVDANETKESSIPASFTVTERTSPTPVPTSRPTPAPTQTPIEKPIIIGDANDDGSVDEKDLASLINYLVRDIVCPSMLNANVDKSEDGVVDLKDLVALSNILVK